MRLAILNIKPDHLDVHGTFLDYIECKKKLIQFTKKKLVLNLDDDISKRLINTKNCLYFSKKTLNARLFKKNLDQMIKEHKIDLCWWDKVDFEKVKIKSFDNLTLVGHYCNLNSLKTVIIVHGFGGSYRETQPYCKLFYEKNFNILAVDNRAHGESEGNCVGFGWLDRKDIISWINYLNEKTPNNKIVLLGNWRFG